MPLGVSTGRIKATMMSASSSVPPYHAHKGRLNSQGYWCADPNDKKPHWRVDLGREFDIESMVIKRNNQLGYVTSFQASFGKVESLMSFVTDWNGQPKVCQCH